MSDKLTARIDIALEFIRRAELYLDTFNSIAVPKTGMVAFISDIRAALEGEDEFSLDRVMKDRKRGIVVERQEHIPMSSTGRFVLIQEGQGDSDANWGTPTRVCDSDVLIDPHDDSQCQYCGGILPFHTANCPDKPGQGDSSPED